MALMRKMMLLTSVLAVADALALNQREDDLILQETEVLIPFPLINWRKGKYLDGFAMNGLTESLLSNVMKRTSRLLRINGDDPQPVPEVSFLIDQHDNQSTEVILDNGLLFGVSDFHVVRETESITTDNDARQSKISGWVEWSRLRVEFTININRMGLRTSGQATAKPGHLLLHLELTGSEDDKISSMKLVSFQMSKVSDVEVVTKGIDAVCDSRKTIEKEVEKSTRSSINNQIRPTVRARLKMAMKKGKDVVESWRR